MDREFGIALLRLAVFLPLVLIFAYLVIRFGLGRVAGSTVDERQMEIMEQLAFGNKGRLAVVRCGVRYFLIGLGDGSPGLIAELPDYPLMAAEAEELEVHSLKTLAAEEPPKADLYKLRPVPGKFQAGREKTKSHE